MGLVLVTDKKKDKYDTIRIPQELAAEMDKLIGDYGFRSRAEIAKEAIRRYLRLYYARERGHLK